MKTFKKRVIAIMVICIILITTIPINRIWAALITVDPETLSSEQKVSFTYTISPDAVGDENLRQISLDTKVENLAVGMLSFRLGWDDTVVVPSIATGDEINKEVATAMECLQRGDEPIDEEGNKISDYIDVDVSNIDTSNNFLYYIMSINRNAVFDQQNYPLVDQDGNITTENGISFGTITFQLREGKKISDITENTFFLKTDFEVVPSGFKMSWYEGDNENQLLAASVVEFIDRIVPTLTDVEIVSNNTNTNYAKVGDTVTLTFEADKPIHDPIITQEKLLINKTN